jgi:HAD superfamily hydrolase (TIGR01509 family)
MGPLIDDRVHAGQGKMRRPLFHIETASAFKAFGIHLFPEDVARHRGRDPLPVVQSLLREHGPARQLAERFEADSRAITEALRKGMIKRLGEIEGPRQGAVELLKLLRSRGVRVAVITFYPREVLTHVLETTGWERDGLVAATCCSEEVKEGRPDPEVISLALQRLGVASPADAVLIADTRVDVTAGRSAGVWTLGVHTSSQDRELLLKGRPDFFVASLDEAPLVFFG